MRPQSDQVYPQKRRRCENGPVPSRAQPLQNNPYSRLSSANVNSNLSRPSPPSNSPALHGANSSNTFHSPAQNSSAPATAGNLPWASPQPYTPQQRSSLSSFTNFMSSSNIPAPNSRHVPSTPPFPPYNNTTSPIPAPPFVPPIHGSIPSSEFVPQLMQMPFMSGSYRNQPQTRSNPIPGSVAAPPPSAPPSKTPSRVRYVRQSPNTRVTSSPSFASNAAPSQQTPPNMARNGTQLFTPGSRTVNSQYPHHHAHSSGRGGNSTNLHQSREGPPMAIRDIQPVKDALALFRDGSPVLVALAQTIVQAGRLNFSSQMQREKILNFKGFPPSLNPNSRWLSALNKHDLDILAWVFCVAKHGRKDEVSKRIISSLMSPLKYRIPASSRKPMIPSRIHARHNNTAQYAAVNSRSDAVGRPRGNMPSLGVQPPSSRPGGLVDPQRMLDNLQRQLSNPRSGGAQQNRDRQMQNICNDTLTDFSFNVWENPFNKPLNPPLGYPRFVLFTSMQLNRGNEDPVLRFLTPPPIDPLTRVEVKGGDVQIHLRCLRVDFEKPKTSWQQTWPFPATCRVNGNNIALNQAQRYTNGKLAGRDSATNITPYLRRYKPAGPNVHNIVVLRRQMNSASASSGQFVLIAQEVLVISHETMTKHVFEVSEKYWKEHRRIQIEKGDITEKTSAFEMARKGVMMFLTDPDGLTVSSMKVSLRCPLGLTRIKTPVKGKKCQHVQCFDLDNFLEYSRRSSKFECPVCNKLTAQPTMLVVSPYIQHALKEHIDCDEVEIFADGTMVQVERKMTGVASDDEEEHDVDKAKSSAGKQRPKVSPAKTCDVVDLTLDSDEESPTPAPRQLRRGSENRTPISGRQEPNRTNGVHAMDNMNHEIDSEVEAQIDQDMVFTFQADDYGWDEISEVGNGSRVQQLPTSNGDKDNWTCDVIAIDSD
eukprot:TRINITY_DN171_c0_g1_i1.p2 TRINITY_DN171_c0_g1~~TRINITY_DN171_c0_g1_i1.p2  ORF type:complete len:931 (-),score=110.76 TRINITY_DN171_c0_g1_i1:20756-23548(-)